MNREQAIQAMKEDIVVATKQVPTWADEVIYETGGQGYTPNQLVKLAEEGGEVGLEFMDTVYIPNREVQDQLVSLLGQEGFDLLMGGMGLPATSEDEKAGR